MNQVSFTIPTVNTDGSAITQALSYVVSIDTVNPPVKAYPVPAANIAAAVGGSVTATFADLGFKPVAGTVYYADVDASNGDNTSADSNVFMFKYTVTPAAPTGFTVG